MKKNERKTMWNIIRNLSQDESPNRLRLPPQCFPHDVIAVINIGRAILQSRGFVGIEPELSGPESIINILDNMTKDPSLTYREALLNYGILSAIHSSENGGPFLTATQERSPGWREVNNGTE